MTCSTVLSRAVKITIVSKDKAPVRRATIGRVIEAVEHRHQTRCAKLVNCAGANDAT
jgi:hypothetical protein